MNNAPIEANNNNNNHNIPALLHNTLCKCKGPDAAYINKNISLSRDLTHHILWRIKRNLYDLNENTNCYGISQNIIVLSLFFLIKMATNMPLY